MSQIIHGGLGAVRGMLRAAFFLFLILASMVTCTSRGGGGKNEERVCSDLSVISRKIGDNVNHIDDIIRQLTTIVKVSNNYNDNINIVFLLEKINLMRVSGAYEQKSLNLLCHIKEDYLADFCQDRLQSLRMTLGLAALYIETIQHDSQKVGNGAARHQLEQVIIVLRSLSDLYQQGIAVLQSLPLSK
jgi:hypothetical protein